MTFEEMIREDSIEILSKRFPGHVAVILLKRWEEETLERNIYNQVTEMLDELKNFWALVKADRE